jgi:hypothetical protein
MTRKSVATAALAALAASAAIAAPVRILQTQTQSGFLAGELEGISVDARGVLSLADRTERVASLDEPFAFGFAPLADGWAVGTGDDGRVLQVRRDGRATVLFDAEEPQVFALWADPDGALFVGTSPDGKIYRVVGGSSAVFFDPGETYIWAIARGGDGALWVATGTEGRLYRVDAQGRGEIAFDSEETHLRSLLPLPGGDLLVGTANSGLILRWRAAEKAVRTVHDASLAEVVALAAAPGGTAYAAVLASEASFLDLAPSKPAAPAAEAAADAEPKPVVTVEGEGETPAPAGSRPPGASGPRSEIVRILAAGAVEPVWQSADETVFSLLWDRDRLWAGTGVEGKLYSFRGEQTLVEKDLEERQIVGLAPGANGPDLLTTNAAALWRFALGRERRGTYTSAALDAGQAARFGVFRWNGDLPAGSRARFSFRTGFSAEPDRTWSEWSDPVEGSEIPLGGLDRGRYLQWRLELSGEGATPPHLTAAEVSYRQENLRPKIERFAALDPGQLLIPTGFNPADQVFEPASPNREGIFTTLEMATAREERTKPVWKKGWRTLRWKVTDPNQDELRYALAVRPEGSAGEPAGEWLEIADDLDDEHYGFDATVLPDGRYRFRLRASDGRGNAEGDALVAEQESEPVVVDHAPPRLVSAARAGRGARVRVYDAWNPLREASLSIDGGEWRPLAAADGLIDGQTEELSVEEIPEGERLVLLRLADAAFNYVTIDLSRELRGR